MAYREEMIKEIKAKVVPELRTNGFTRSYPYFKRVKDDKIDLLAFQFNKWGGSFLMEISSAYPNREEYRNFDLCEGENLDKIEVAHTYARHRLRETTENPDACWFEFNKDNITEVAGDVIMLLPSANEWWNDPPIMEELRIRKERGLRY